MSVAVTRDELLKRASSRGATVAEMCDILKCNTYRYYQLKKEERWIATAILLEAATRCLKRRGHVGLQTTLMHFC